MNIKTYQPRKILSWRLALVLLIGINLIIGGITYRDYGDSYDEAGLREYASQTLDAYKKFHAPVYVFQYAGNDVQYYGPAFVMGVELIVRTFHLPTVGPSAGDIWHLAYFISFLIATTCVYFLGRRWLSNWSAFGIALLFSSQPLLWGHAFINPKDTPFMGFILLSVVSGLWLCDKIDPNTYHPEWIKLISQSSQRIKQNYLDMSRHSKKKAGILSLIFLLSITALVVLKGVLNNWIANIILKSYSDSPTSIFGIIFSKLARHKDTLPIENYVHKAQLLLSYFKFPYFVFGLIFIGWLYRECLPWTFHLPSKKAILLFFRKTGVAFLSPPVLIAGTILGLTTSIRVLAPLVGVIVCIYALWKKGKNAIPALAAYAIIAMIVMYCTWPYLWSNPVGNLIDSVKLMSNFFWPGRILFNGNSYFSTNLPWYYLPELMAIQFTEPVILLFVSGFFIALYKLIRKQNSILIISLIWFFIPIGYLILTQRPLYDNFRQFLFLVPPVFLLSGIALDGILRIAGKIWIKILILAILVLPGFYWIWNLHPYEYIYYNSFTGNVKGAYEKFDLDYWTTSFRETTVFINLVAQPNKQVMVWGARYLVEPYARKDLIIESKSTAPSSLTGSYYYAILGSRNGQNEIYPNDNPIFTVERDGAILAVVKQPSLSSKP
jgi:hypothetical protein